MRCRSRWRRRRPSGRSATTTSCPSTMGASSSRCSLCRIDHSVLTTTCAHRRAPSCIRCPVTPNRSIVTSHSLTRRRSQRGTRRCRCLVDKTCNNSTAVLASDGPLMCDAALDECLALPGASTTTTTSVGTRAPTTSSRSTTGANDDRSLFLSRHKRCVATLSTVAPTFVVEALPTRGTRSSSASSTSPLSMLLGLALLALLAIR